MAEFLTTVKQAEKKKSFSTTYQIKAHMLLFLYTS